MFRRGPLVPPVSNFPITLAVSIFLGVNVR